MGNRERDEENGDNASSIPSIRRKKGGWTAVKYILGNETFEKLASMSLIANITVYLRTQYNLDGILLVNVVNIWSGSCNFLTLPGAFLSDACLGRFWTLLLGSIFSMMGMAVITLGSGIKSLRPPSCEPDEDCISATSWQLAVLFIGLLLVAVGSGCIRPCNIAFGADQFDVRTEKGRAMLSRFYNWWYFSFTISLLVALTTVVYIQTNISWTIGFAIPTSCFAVSIIIFIVGYPTYVYKKPRGSIFIDMVKVMVASYKKRKISVDDQQISNRQIMFYDPPCVSYEYDEDENDDDNELNNDNNSTTNNSNVTDMSSVIPKLNRSNRLKWLDKACFVVDPSEINEHGIAINNWRLCSVQQVEQLKSIVGILPIWFTGILCFISMDQQNTFGVLQAIQMNRKLSKINFVIPPAWAGFFSMTALSIWILTYERVIIPLMKRIKKKDDVRLSIETRIKIGIVMSILCMAVGALVESKRRAAALKRKSFVSPLFIGYLFPQFILSGMIEAFASVTIMEFLTTQMPEYMRSMAGSIFFISLSMASYTSTVVVNIIYRATRKSDGVAWLGGHDLNTNKLDYFYALIACIGVLNYFYFSCFASKYVFIDQRKVSATTQPPSPAALETHSAETSLMA